MKKLGGEKRASAAEMLLAGRSFREVAAALDISIGSVHNIAREPAETTALLVEEIKKRLANRHYMLADHILGMIDVQDLYKASLKDKAIAAAILIDKARLIEGAQPRQAASPAGPSDGAGGGGPNAGGAAGPI